MTMNLYPIKTKVTGTQVRNLRLRADDSGTVVWQLNRATGEVDEFVRTNELPERVGASQNWRVGEFVFEPQRGCGCSHPMYAWIPPES